MGKTKILPNKSFDRKPKVFIGSTVEAIDYAEALMALFSHDPFDIVLWNTHFEDGFESTITQLKEIQEYDFGIVFFTPDDKIKSRGKTYNAPRDNVIFELGLLIGILGTDRVFPIIPQKSEIKLPSDLIGTHPLKFDHAKGWTDFHGRKIALQNAYSFIKDKIYKKGNRNSILIHPTLLLSPTSDELLFKIAFTGPNSMIDVKFSSHLIIIDDDFDNKKTCNWKLLKLTTDTAPEVKFSWTFSHRFVFESEDNSNFENVISPLLRICKEESKIGISTLRKLKNYKIHLDILAYDSTNMIPIHASNEFGFSDIKQGRFKKFYTIKQDGDVDENSIDWDLFYQIEATAQNRSNIMAN